ncbi:cytochrome c biogenesis protein ResB [Saxibacter everestensis]|uniref:Cytochrome c biogenesis protein ResB n=1 Tax=Saxibacter everestensis TaxID=2909229 RepID=A0ABY8QRB7_9MICO|nr:cytochrome c biogenesis protein ResB [Brevibacteriaceae bacterium ZFBP1038]
MVTTRGPSDRRDQYGEAADSASSDGVPGPGDDTSVVTQPKIGVVGILRWAWRQLTTMRVALMLLLLLALAAIPGSIFPQRIQDPAEVTQYITDKGTTAEWMDKVQLFDVYSSAWFSAIYILLLVSLIGCILPRTKIHWKAMRAKPPKAPRRMSRMPAFARLELAPAGAAEPGGTVDAGETAGAGETADAGAGETDESDRATVLTEAERILRRRRYRVVHDSNTVSAERGYLRETGNLLFHVAVVGVVIAMAIGGLFGYSGQRVLVEGETFTNSLLGFDSFDKGTYYDPDRLTDYAVTLDKFEATFEENGGLDNQFGQPRSFRADVTTRHNGEEKKEVVEVNDPLHVGGSNMYLTGNGYAPVITLRDGEGNVVFSGPTVFLPQTGAYMSRGVVKSADASPEQLGLVGIFFPTAGKGDDGQVTSTFADLYNPYMVLSGYYGDLGLDDGVAQSVYTLNPENMTEMTDKDGKPMALELAPGESADLPNNLGSVSFDGVKRYVSLDVRYDPGQIFVLVFALLGLAGLAASLFIPRRRIWVKVTNGKSTGLTVEVAGLARGEDNRLEVETRQVAEDLRHALGTFASVDVQGEK